MIKPVLICNIYGQNHTAGNVWDTEYVCTTLLTAPGGGHPIIIEEMEDD